MCNLWTDPQNDEERRIAHLFRLGAPLNLDPFFATMWRLSQKEPGPETINVEGMPLEKLAALATQMETQEKEDRRIDGVTPCLHHLGGGEYRLGDEDELGPIFSGPAGQVVNQAMDWIRQALSETV